ncbi:MAG: DUF58 domain-containing protein [Verrucomicrobiales bacterium]|nr:DUF58 domain-containing protein [Verrucomicrobiales bacterium]
MAKPPTIQTKDQQDISEILRKIRKIELKTRGLVRESIGGEYQSCFKGEGIDFEDFREYQHGDEVRSIDWNVTARMGTPFIKKFTEQRELTVILAVDISASGNYGSHEQSKRELIAEISALLAFSALQNKDKVGLILFTDQIEKYVPPLKGASHTLRLIREILYCHPTRHQTELADTVHILRNHIKRRSLVFLISDFLFADDQLDELKSLSRQHDLVAIQVGDPAEKELPAVGPVRLEDPETGEQIEINTSNPKIRQAYQRQAQRWQEQLDSHFRKLGVDKIDLVTDQEYLPALHSFFKRRGGLGN